MSSSSGSNTNPQPSLPGAQLTPSLEAIVRRLQGSENEMDKELLRAVLLAKAAEDQASHLFLSALRRTPADLCLAWCLATYIEISQT